MSIDKRTTSPAVPPGAAAADARKAGDAAKTPVEKRPPEIGGPPGPEPTRYGDWQFNGRVTDF